jgi:energy-coupling factor transporter ATP-binding protein EcfA2
MNSSPETPTDVTIDPSTAAQLRERLAAADLDQRARAAVEEAIGDPKAASAPGGVSPGVYLRSVSVRGFRGIGPEATLELQPRPGLTVVVGRNGSGKSSFAEGLELVMTGTTKRWDTTTKAWSSAWQCLHHADATRVAAELVVAGEPEPVRLERTWARGATYTDASGAASAVATLGARGWTEALASFRPFLSYGELASMFDKLTSLYEALSPVLGLEDVDAVLKRVSDRRLALDNADKAVKAKGAELASGLDHDDERQALLASLLGKRTPDPAAIRAHLDVNPPGLSASGEQSAGLRARASRTVADDDALRAAANGIAEADAARRDLADTDAERARRIATLLEQAVALRDAGQLVQDCPVCGTREALDAAWDARAQEEIAAQRVRARDLEAALQTVAAARRRWEALLQQLELPPDAPIDDALSAAAALREDAAAAREQLQGLDQAWRAKVEATTAWLADAAAIAEQAAELKAVKAAETWLKGVGDELRNERFAPIAAQAVANWQELRHESNVELHDIRLRSVGRRREASFDVRADGEEASALGVMSQGELLALSVSVFLPRAGLDESPFRFAVIDDPVQSMDPAKVDGLARVLARASQTRQVVVFTHDDRLPDAIRRLRVPAEVLQVLRQSRSRVTVRKVRSPLLQHLKEAKTMALSDRVPDGVRQRVVPTLCRGAVEAACADLVRARAVRDGVSVTQADEQLDEARTLRQQLALTLLGDAGQGDRLRDELVRVGGREAPPLVQALNAGAHGEFTGSVRDLPARTEDFVHALFAAA